MPKAFAAHLRHVGRRYSTEPFQRVVLTRDNAPWHRGKLRNEALVDNPHLQLYRLPSYSPNLKVSERFGKKRRRRARHHRLFDTIAELKESIRVSLGSFQTIREKVLTLSNRRSKRSPK